MSILFYAGKYGNIMVLSRGSLWNVRQLPPKGKSHAPCWNLKVSGVNFEICHILLYSILVLFNFYTIILLLLFIMITMITTMTKTKTKTKTETKTKTKTTMLMMMTYSTSIVFYSILFYAFYILLLFYPILLC